MRDRSAATARCSCQYSFRFLYVSGDLRRELGRARERELIAKSLDECGLDLLAVDLVREVQEISLEHPFSTTESRSDTERCGRFETSLPHLHPHRVDAVAWEQANAWQREVDGRKSEGPSALRPVHHAPANAVRPPEKTRGGLDIARQQKIANSGGAHDRPVDLDRRHHVHDKPIALPSLAQLFDVALGTAAEVKVRTDNDPPNIARPLDPIHELVGGELRECVVEPEDH